MIDTDQWWSAEYCPKSQITSASSYHRRHSSISDTVYFRRMEILNQNHSSRVSQSTTRAWLYDMWHKSLLLLCRIQRTTRRAFNRAHASPSTLNFDLDLPKFNHLVPYDQRYDWRSLVTIGLVLEPGSCSQTYIPVYLYICLHTDAVENITSHQLRRGGSNWTEVRWETVSDFSSWRITIAISTETLLDKIWQIAEVIAICQNLSSRVSTSSGGLLSWSISETHLLEHTK